jgi:ATP-binding cassette subfamily F protein uup
MQDQEFKQIQEQVQIDTPGRRIGTKVIEVNNISKFFGDRCIIKDFTYEFNPGDRVGIIGPNGAGKSTLMNMLTGRLEPDQGVVDIGQTIHFGYFDQHSDDILSVTDPDKRVIDYIKDVAAFVTTADGTQISASQMLERFLFTPNQQYTPIHKLSGGEKRRLFLLKMLMGAPNVILLDEPTNDLDVQTLGVLEEYIQAFNGCVLVVSHDRYFLDRTVDSIFAIEPGGTVKQYPGNYSVYLEFKQEKEAIAANQAQSTKIANPKTKSPQANKPKSFNSNKPKRLSNYQRRELEKLEAKTIPHLEQLKSSIEQQLYQNPPNDYQKLEELTAELAKVSTELDEVTEKWLELAELEQ